MREIPDERPISRTHKDSPQPGRQPDFFHGQTFEHAPQKTSWERPRARERWSSSAIGERNILGNMRRYQRAPCGRAHMSGHAARGTVPARTPNMPPTGSCLGSSSERTPQGLCPRLRAADTRVTPAAAAHRQPERPGPGLTGPRGTITATAARCAKHKEPRDPHSRAVCAEDSATGVCSGGGRGRTGVAPGGGIRSLTAVPLARGGCVPLRENDPPQR